MPTADLLIENARLITMTDQPEGAGSIAVCDGKILALGTRDDLARAAKTYENINSKDTMHGTTSNCNVETLRSSIERPAWIGGR